MLETNYTNNYKKATFVGDGWQMIIYIYNDDMREAKTKKNLDIAAGDMCTMMWGKKG